MRTKGFLLLLVAVFFKQILWIILLPAFQTPDEQAHFAQLAYFAEHKTQVLPTNVDLSVEVAVTEELLGTRRDSRGNNKFTYHPEYNIPYSLTYQGLFEQDIATLSATGRTTYVGSEAAHYPRMGYVVSLPFYYLAYDGVITDRLFASRLLNLFVQLLTVAVAFKIGKTIWNKELPSLVLAIMVSFHPMISFVAAGVHPDNLLNLLYSLGLLLLLRLLKRGITAKTLFGLLIVSGLGMYTKQLIFPLYPLILATLAYVILQKYKVLALLSSFLCILAPIPLFFLPIDLPYLSLATVHHITLPEYINFRIRRLFFEMWPWYWGVFRWLSFALPPEVMRIITRVGIVAAIGIVAQMGLLLGKKRAFTFESKALILFVVSSASYIVYLFLWDFRLWDHLGFSQGLQGRYLFPNIVAHMAILEMGLWFLVRRWERLARIGLVTLAISMMALNALTLYLLSVSYYSLASFESFVIQASQYKPWWAEGIFIPIGMFSAGASLCILVVVLVRVGQKKLQ